jgi:branched-chain amino acid transport system permease protein
MAMMTTFIGFTLLNHGLGYWWAFVAVLGIAFVFGALVERILIRPLQGKSELNPVIVTIGLLVVLEGLAGAIYGNSSRGFPAAYSQSGLTIGHTQIAFSHFDIFILVAVVVLMVGTLLLFRATTLGLRMRASAFSGEISRLLGVRVGRLLTLGWALAGMAGALAGFLVAPTSSFSPYFMDLVLVYAFTAAVIGGLESPVGALIGGLITGLSISYVGGYLGSGLQPLGALVLLIVTLMGRPEGIFARPTARRV